MYSCFNIYLFVFAPYQSLQNRMTGMATGSNYIPKFYVNKNNFVLIVIKNISFYLLEPDLSGSKMNFFFFFNCCSSTDVSIFSINAHVLSTVNVKKKKYFLKGELLCTERGGFLKKSLPSSEGECIQA